MEKPKELSDNKHPRQDTEDVKVNLPPQKKRKPSISVPVDVDLDHKLKNQFYSKDEETSDLHDMRRVLKRKMNETLEDSEKKDIVGLTLMSLCMMNLKSSGPFLGWLRDAVFANIRQNNNNPKKNHEELTTVIPFEESIINIEMGERQWSESRSIITQTKKYKKDGAGLKLEEYGDSAAVLMEHMVDWVSGRKKVEPASDLVIVPNIKETPAETEDKGNHEIDFFGLNSEI